MATEFDFSNFGSMFGGGMGGTPTGLDALFNEDQRKLMGRNAALSAAAALLQASGRSTTPIGLGQALGSALQAGQQGYQQARTGSVQDLLLNQKLEEAKRNAVADANWLKLIQGQGGVSMPTMQQAMPPVPLTGVAVPPVERFMSETMPPPMATAPAAESSIFSGLSPEQRALIGSLGRDKGVPELLKMSSAASEFGDAKPVVLNGKTVMVQTNKLGQTRVAPNMMPYEAQSQDIRAFEYITGKPLAGTGPTGVSDIGTFRGQIAPRTVIENKLPAGPNQFVQAGGTAAMGLLGDATIAAKAANDTLRNIDLIAPALDQALLGPGADYRTVMTRIGSQLNIAGENAEATLQNTRQVVQGLAQSELTAAAAMKGQGAITENERALIKRVAAGDQSMTAAELRTGMAAMQKLANQRLLEQSELLTTARGVQGFSPIAPMFEVKPYTPQFNLGSNLNFGNALNKAIQNKAK